MSNLPNKAIRLVPPTLRGGYCPDSWTEFARTIVGGTSAQVQYGPFYNIGNTAPYPPPPPPPVPCDYDLLIDLEPANFDIASKIAWVSVNQLEPATGVTEIVFGASGIVSNGIFLGYLPGVTKVTIPNATELTTGIFSSCVSLQRMQDLLEFSAVSLVTTALIRVQDCPSITTISLPSLTTGPTYVSAGNAFIIRDNASLTDVNIGSFVPHVSVRGYFNNNALNAASVNHILARFAANPSWNFLLDLSGGTNAAPTGQGIIDKADLLSRGATVTTN